MSYEPRAGQPLVLIYLVDTTLLQFFGTSQCPSVPRRRTRRQQLTM